MVLTKYVKIIITGSILKRSEAHVISPPITLNPHRTFSQSYKRLNFARQNTTYYPKFTLNTDKV